MDKKRFKVGLDAFRHKCAERGYPLADLCVEELDASDPNTPFFVKVKAKWVDGMRCSQALDILIDAMWASTTEDLRLRIFTITIHDMDDAFHCRGDISARAAS